MDAGAESARVRESVRSEFVEHTELIDVLL